MIRFHRIVIFLFCIGLITIFLGLAATQNRESSSNGFLDDSVITSELKDAIVDEPYKREVQLNGFVNSEQSLSRAEDFTPTGLRGSDWLQITWSL
jgi:hypothetical protein